MDNRELVKLAFKAREASYSPYSNYAVGAALLCTDGSVVLGCNIENVGYSATNCAERTAFFKAVSEGKREFEKIAIVGGCKDQPIGDFAYPCGVCRQVMREFCNPEKFHVIIAKSEDEYVDMSLEKLLPLSFGPDRLI